MLRWHDIGVSSVSQIIVSFFCWVKSYTGAWRRLYFGEYMMKDPLVFTIQVWSVVSVAISYPLHLLKTEASGCSWSRICVSASFLRRGSPRWNTCREEQAPWSTWLVALEWCIGLKSIPGDIQSLALWYQLVPFTANRILLSDSILFQLPWR